MLDRQDSPNTLKAPSWARIPMLGVLSAALLLTAPVAAHAQEAAGPEVASTEAESPSSTGLSINLSSSFNQRFDSVTVPQLNLPDDAVGSSLFRLDLSDTACYRLSENCSRDSERVDLGLRQSFISNSDDGIDLVLRPRASVRFDERSRSALVGAVVEIGENLREGSDFKSNTWYLFAGADAEALTYSPDGITDFSTGSFHLQDRIIVGDAQAGVGYRIGDADVSLSYTRREAQAEDFNYTEDAAALSFTWKR